MRVSVGAELRSQGLERVSKHHGDWLDKVRAYAWVIAHAKGTVSVNDLKIRFALPPDAHHNLWGAVFNHSDFEPVGYTVAEHSAAHARTVHVFALTNGGRHLTSKLEWPA